MSINSDKKKLLIKLLNLVVERHTTKNEASRGNLISPQKLLSY